MIATHDKDDVLAFTDRTIIMREGQVIDNRETTQVYKNPKTIYGASLFDDVNVIPAGLLDNDEELLCYPHNLIIAPTGLQVNVTDCYFSGRDYIITASKGDLNLYIKSEQPFKIGDSISVSRK
jgi:ABC-type Fe3+/spermidine/putrescine transport system ATPase subunit